MILWIYKGGLDTKLCVLYSPVHHEYVPLAVWIYSQLGDLNLTYKS